MTKTGGELFGRLQAHGRYTEGQAARIMAEILLAVEHLHSQGMDFYIRECHA